MPSALHRRRGTTAATPLGAATFRSQGSLLAPILVVSLLVLLTCGCTVWVLWGTSVARHSSSSSSVATRTTRSNPVHAHSAHDWLRHTGRRDATRNSHNTPPVPVPPLATPFTTTSTTRGDAAMAAAAAVGKEEAGETHPSESGGDTDDDNNNNNNNTQETMDDTTTSTTSNGKSGDEEEQPPMSQRVPHNNNNNNKNVNTKPLYPYDLTVPATLTHTSSTATTTTTTTTWDASSFVPPGGSRFEEYKDGSAPYQLTTTIRLASDTLARARRTLIRAAMEHAWTSYERYAFGQDELAPQSGTGTSRWGGMGTTLVDSLDTLWLMGMKDEFKRARDWVSNDLDFSHVGAVSFFETTIRSLGGLLSAYDWTGDDVFLVKAQDLGDRLFRAFSSPSGFPYSQVHLGTGRTNNIGWTGGNAILAEGGTCQMEFRYLAKATQTTKYATASERAFQVLKDMDPPHGLYPYFVRIGKQKPEFANSKLTFGAMADSFYEYMLKLWLQGGKTEPMYREMYDKSIQGMHDELLQTSTPSGLMFIADKTGTKLDTKMDHLVCFMGGLLALGAYTDPLGLESERAQRDLRTGKALTYTCYQMYARMPTGIAAEFVQFYDEKDFVPGRGAPHYLLRPETVESFFILSYLTGDPVYREWGWEVFQAIERYCKTKYGYGALPNVGYTTGKPKDSMESFFLAETLKYLFLLFDPDTEVDILTKHVFNTEAHPMRMFPILDEATA